MNIRSIGSNFTDLLTLLQRISVSLDVILLTECWLSKAPFLPSLQGFVSTKSTFKNQNDGVVAYIRDGLGFDCQLPTINDANCLLLKFSNKIAVLAIYRSPSVRNVDSFVVSLDSVLKTLDSNKDIAIIGDLNINISLQSTDTNADIYLNTAASYGMLPAHTFPTRHDNCLDHVIIRTNSHAVTLVLDSFVTDHAPTILCWGSKKH